MNARVQIEKRDCERMRSQFNRRAIMGDLLKTNQNFYDDMRNIIIEVRNSAVQSVERMRVLTYWRLGERIFVEEQGEKDRAGYGEQLIGNVSKRLEILS
jgi:hypothetical protein